MMRARDAWLAPCAIVLGALALATPVLCRAEAYGPADPQLTFLIGLVVGLPIALACVLGEVILPRRLLPDWLTIAAALAAVAALGLAAHALRTPARSSMLAALWLVLPVCATVALRGAVPWAWLRLAAGWLLTLAVLGLVAALHPDEATKALLIGAALTCLAAWSAAIVLLGLLRAVPDVRSRDAAVGARSIAAALGRGLAGAWQDLRALVARLSPGQYSLAWWLGSAALLYFGLGTLIATGVIGMLWFEAPLAQLQDFLGLRLPRVSKPIQVWWSYYGLGWSLLVGGAVWALAATLRLLDPGRARAVRLPALLFGLALSAWSVYSAVRIMEIEAAEAKASGLRR
jgi:hypothetical protein